MAPQDQIPGERFQNGQRVKVLIKRVKNSTKGTQIVLSRENYMFINGFNK
ncbi:MAG: hypothetical protein IJF72_02715 [Clostridia bacterium]|nr:hypothetical protein [Clostridia bacterium]